MKISKSKKKACTGTQTAEAVTDINKYQASIDYIKAAIGCLGEIASEDEVAKDAIANLSVVLLDLA